MNFTGINLEYAVKSNQLGQRYPALQATNYQPRTLSEKIEFCLSDTSYDLLDHDAQLFETEVIECAYKREPVLMHKIVSPVRWVFLNLPSIFLYDKKTKEISYPERGMKLAGTSKVTIAKCFLACLCGDNLILDIDGLPQIFSLKLTSNKTQLIGYLNNQSETKTILSLNTALQKHFKVKENLLHLVSVQLVIKPKEFVSSHSGDSSLGVLFEIEDDAQALSHSHQQQIFELISDENVQALFDDPFGLRKPQAFNHQSTVVDSGEIEREGRRSFPAMSNHVVEPEPIAF